MVLEGCGSAIFASEFIGVAGISLAFGFTLTLIHLISIPLINTSVNTVRSVAVALFVKTPVLN